MEQVEMSIKTEVEMAAKFVVHTDSEINVKFFKQDQGLIQSVKNEPSFANDALVKEEILEDSTQDERERQSVHDAPTSAATGGVNETCSTSLGDLLNVKYESTEMDIGPTLLQDMDTYYTINKNTSAAPEEIAILDDYNEATPGGRVKKESVEEMWRDDSEQHCAEGLSTAAGTGSLYEANDLSHGDCLSVKQELEDIDIGPTVLQHMDIHYALNKKPVDDFNKAMRCSGVNKSLEDKLRGNKIKCDYCGQTTTHYDEAHLKSCLGQQKALQQHLLRQQQTTITNCFRCDEGGKTFRKSHLLSTHRKLHERNSATSGATSSSVATSSSIAGPSNVRRSEGAKAELKRFKCNLCDKEFASEANLSAHKRFHSGVGMSVCRICSAKFNSKNNLTIHLRAHTGEKPYPCDTCNSRFTRASNLTKHKRVHTGEKPYQCDTCNARFTQACNLTKHKRVHTGERPYQCDTCNARFTQVSNLTKHKIVHTGEKLYQCDTCNARFADGRYLTTHKRVHTGEKPYQCDTCNARFAQASNLTKHKRVHTGDKPYQCDTCNARFADGRYLTTHKRVHMGEKPYQCDTCYARFTTRSNLTTHKRVHTGEKPYHCGTCNARFTTNSVLTIHKRVHTGEKPFECTECGDKFTQKGTLNTHLKKAPLQIRAENSHTSSTRQVTSTL